MVTTGGGVVLGWSPLVGRAMLSFSRVTPVGIVSRRKKSVLSENGNYGTGECSSENLFIKARFIARVSAHKRNMV